MSETSIGALRAADQRQGVIANNIANANTIGGASQKTLFSSLVAGTATFGNFTPGGVKATVLSDPNAQGLLQSTGRSLDLGIAGRGMLVYGKQDGDTTNFAYSRAGQIVINKEGNLVNASTNYQLMGYETDEKGIPKLKATGNLKSLRAININQAKALAKPQASSRINGTINLPSEISSSSSENSKESALTVYDSLGEVHELTLTWTKTVDNPATWTLDITVQGSGGTVTKPDTSPYTGVEIVFDGSGNPITFDGGTEMPDIEINWNNAANNSTIQLDLGTQGTSEGITTLAGSFEDNLKADGKETGKFSDLSTDEQGNVIALFTNGESIQFAKLALIDFPASHALSLTSGNLYLQSASAGQYSLAFANTNGLGSIQSGALEQSTVDLAENLTLMMENQRFYQSNTSVLKGEDEMYQALVRLQK